MTRAIQTMLRQLEQATREAAKAREEEFDASMKDDKHRAERASAALDKALDRAMEILDGPRCDLCSRRSKTVRKAKPSDTVALCARCFKETR